MKAALLASALISLAVLSVGHGTGTDTELTRATAILSAVKADLETIDRQLSRVAQLEQTIQIMTPMLADRSKSRAGDINGDGKLDSKDLSMVWGCQGCPASQPTSAAFFADVNADGKVDSADMLAVNTAIKTVR